MNGALNDRRTLDHEASVRLRNESNSRLLAVERARVRRLLEERRINDARAHELLDRSEERYELKDYWDQDHWPDTTWPQESFQSEIAFGHPGYRFSPLTWTQVVVTLKDGATRRGTIIQVMGKWVTCIVQLTPQLKPGAYPFRCDKVRPWEREPVPYSGVRKTSHLEVETKEETKPTKKVKVITKKEAKQRTITNNNLFR